jgi:hypothetical protein
MIYNITRTDINTDQAVDQLIGKRFGILYKLRNGGIGSEPFIIYTASPDFQIELESQEYDRKCNIELRPKGIIVHFRKRSSSFIWPIPFDQLTLNQSGNLLTVNGDTSYAKLKPRVKSKKNSPFIQKMIDAKAKHSTAYKV